MTINAISDIHASFDTQTGEVLYSLPRKRSLGELAVVIASLREAVEKAFSQDSWTKYVSWRQDDSSFYTLTGLVEALSELESSAKTGFAAFSNPDATNRVSSILAAVASGASCCRQCEDKKLSRASCAALERTSDLAKVFRDGFESETMSFKPELLKPADYLVVAGDLGTMDCYRSVLADLEKRTAGKFKRVLAIPGNHDYWLRLDKSKTEDIHGDWTRCEHVDGDIVFLGCTLWTPVSDDSFDVVYYRMNDYRYIPGKATPATTSQLYAEQSAWLKSKIEEHAGKKVVVFTHHNPFHELASERFRSPWDEPVNEAYVVSDNSLDDIGERGNIALWICGHTHECFDGELRGIHVVRNPIGYGSLFRYSYPENYSGSWYDKIIEI